MWGTSSSGFDKRLPLIPEISWDESQTIGDFVSGTGVQITGGTKGNLGLEFQFKLDGGTVDVNYPIDVKIDIPQANTFNVGNNITLSSDYLVKPEYDLKTVFPNAEAKLNFIFGLGFNLSGKACAFDECLDITLPLPNLERTEIPLLQVSTPPGDTFYPCQTSLGIPTICTDNAFPVAVGNIGDLFTANIDLPHVVTTPALAANQKSLQANGSYDYLGLNLSLTKLIANMNIPIVSQAFELLNGSLDIPIPLLNPKINYNLFETSLAFRAKNNQAFTFDPTIWGKLELPMPVNYTIVEKSGTTIETNYKNEIVFKVGNKVNIDYPCNYDFVDVKHSYSLTNNFRNRTYDTYGVGLAVQALTFGISTDKVVIIPELCIPLVGCTPELAFGPFDFGVGPLLDETPTVDFDNDYFDETWSLGGFNEVNNLNTFRLQPRKLEIAVTTTDLKCHGIAEGQATVSVTGGNEPYNFKWSADGQAISVTNLSAGKHYVKLTDAEGCVTLKNFEISEPEALALSLDAVQNKCFGEAQARVSSKVGGGTGTYKYSWSSGQSSANIENLKDGTYTLTVTDANNCEIAKDTQLVSPSELKTQIVRAIAPSCFGYSNGALETESSGGTSPYKYAWSSGQISKNIEQITAGIYKFVVTDANNCSKDASVTLTTPPQLEISAQVLSNVSCKGGHDGAISFVGVGGTPPYSKLLTNSTITKNIGDSSINNLFVGDYLLIISDSNLCENTQKIEINEPEAQLATMAQVKEVSCYNGNDGTASLTINGGTSPYNIVWSNGENGAVINNLSKSSIQANIIDAKGCLDSLLVEIPQPDSIEVKLIWNDVSCKDANDGYAEILVWGGRSPYKYQWSEGNNTFMIQNKEKGTYGIKLTDANNCIVDTAAKININLVQCLNIPNAFSPNNDDYNDTWILRNIELYPNIQVNIYNIWNNLLYNSTGYTKPWDGTFHGNVCSEGTYYYTIDLQNGDPAFTGSLTIIK